MQVLTITEVHDRVDLLRSEYDTEVGDNDIFGHAIWTLQVDHAIDVADTWPKFDGLFIDFNA